jgi:hypothetical protein
MLNFQDFICTLARWKQKTFDLGYAKFSRFYLHTWKLRNNIKMGHDLRTSSQQHRGIIMAIFLRRGVVKCCSDAAWRFESEWSILTPNGDLVYQPPCPPALLGGHRHIAQHGYLCITKEFVRDSCCHVQLLTLDKITWHIIHLFFVKWHSQSSKRKLNPKKY